MYLVTGATGFIGKHLVDQLVERDGVICLLVREESRDRLQDLIDERWRSHRDRFNLLSGDISRPRCGLSQSQIDGLRDPTKHVFHLAAIYDMDVDRETALAANVSGTRNVVGLTNALGATLHYTSSIAIAGEHPGTFREDMFDEGQDHPNAYFESKFEAEKVARSEARGALRIYRPGVVIGSSQTGEADKVDGPYFAFKLIQRLRSALPQWLPLVGLEGGKFHLVPVDYVARAMDHIAHQPGLDGKTFHLTDPKPLSFGDAINEFCGAAHAPRFTARVDSRVFKFIPQHLLQMAGSLPAVRSARDELLAEVGIPASVLRFVSWRTAFDTRDTEAALAGSGIECPALDTYAWKIWDYYERQLDPDLHRDRSLAGILAGKTVLITGASSGIGKTVAMKAAAAGATTLLVARTPEKLDETRNEIEAAGGKAQVYRCDLSDEAACDALVSQVLSDHGGVDVLINNAGRSIRRSVHMSYDRFHDFQRTMQLNYFGSLKLILGFLPGMRENKRGHIINVSSLGCVTNVPRFSAYLASKAALDQLCRSIASEIISDNVAITTVYMPLVRTPMIKPTKIYDSFPAITPDEAANLVVNSVIDRPKRVTTKLGNFSQAAQIVAPKLVDRILNVGYRLFPESKPRNAPEQPRVSIEAVAFAHLLRGLHW